MIHRTITLSKFKKLKRRLGFSKDRDVVGLLETMWLLTQRETPHGDIGRLDDETLAIELEWDGEPEVLIEALVETRWLERHAEYRLIVHDWSDHAPRYVHSLVKRSGREFVESDVDVVANTVGNTLPDTLPDVSPDVEANTRARPLPNLTKPKPNLTKPQRRSRENNRDYSPDFLRFWEIYPPTRKGSKPTAWHAWQAAILRAPPDAILAAAAEFAASDLAKSEFCPGPAPWLNQDRWDDDREAWRRRDGPNGARPKNQPVRMEDYL